MSAADGADGPDVRTYTVNIPAPREDRSPTIGELAAALAMTQSEIRAAEKDRANPFFKSNYSTLASVWQACRDHLGKHGLAVVQVPQLDAGEGARMFLDTWLIHKSGEWMRSRYPVNPVKNDPQGLGSAVTYARRYALAAMVGVYSADDDDDGEGAMGRKSDATARTHQQGPPRNMAELKERESAPIAKPVRPGAIAGDYDDPGPPDDEPAPDPEPLQADPAEWVYMANLLVAKLDGISADKHMKAHKKKYANDYASLKDHAHDEYARVVEAGKRAADRIASASNT